MTIEEFQQRLRDLVDGHLEKSRTLMAQYETDLAALIKEVEAANLDGDLLAAVAQVEIGRMTKVVQGLQGGGE